MLSHKIQISISCTITRTVLYLFSLHTSQKVCLELLFDFAIADRDLRIWGLRVNFEVKQWRKWYSKVCSATEHNEGALQGAWTEAQGWLPVGLLYRSAPLWLLFGTTYSYTIFEFVCLVTCWAYNKYLKTITASKCFPYCIHILWPDSSNIQSNTWKTTYDTKEVNKEI